MTEVGGNAAVYVNPESPAQAARQIAEAWPRRTELIARGLDRSSEWNASRMIDRYLETYARLIAPRPYLGTTVPGYGLRLGSLELCGNMESRLAVETCTA